MKIATQILRLSVVAVVCAVAAGSYAASSEIKDIVIDRIQSSPRASISTQARPVNAVTSIGANGDAMVVRLLLESANGALKPRPTNTLFHSGDRFRVKMRASRDGKVALYNTKPTGELVAEPLWRGDVSRGLEIISPAMRLEGTKGIDQLHIVLEPAQAAGDVTWLGGWLGGKNKDIRLDVQNTNSDTYLLGVGDKGLVTTVRIKHK
jgi:hypothetical protein